MRRPICLLATLVALPVTAAAQGAAPGEPILLDEIGSPGLYNSSLYEFMPIFRADAEAVPSCVRRHVVALVSAHGGRGDAGPGVPRVVAGRYWLGVARLRAERGMDARRQRVGDGMAEDRETDDVGHDNSMSRCAGARVAAV